MIRAVRRSLVRCCRCRSLRIRLREISEAVTTFEQGADGVLCTKGLRADGTIAWLDAECASRGFMWRVRGATGIVDLPNHPDNAVPPPRRPRGRPRRDLDRARVMRALREAAGSIRRAAARAGIPRMTLSRYVARERIPESAWRAGPSRPVAADARRRRR